MTLTVQLAQSSTDPTTRVLLDNLDVTEYVRSLHINASVYALTEVTMELIGIPIGCRVSVPFITQQYLLPFDQPEEA